MTRILFHLGYQKTGTSTLQRKLFVSHPDINYMSPNADGTTAILRDPFTETFHKTMPVAGPDRRATARQIWQDHMVPHLDPHRLNLVSEEGFMVGTAGPAEVLDRVAALSPQPEVMFVLRSQQDFIRSLYDMFPNIDPKDNGTSKIDPIADYVDHMLDHPVFVPYLRYADRIAQAQSLFGPDRVHVFTFAEIYKTRQGVPRLAHLLGVSTDDVLAAISGPAVHDFAMYGMRRRIRRLLGPIRGSWFLPIGVLRAINMRLGRLTGVKRTTLPQAEAARIAAFFAGDTQKLGSLLPSLGPLS
jgi:Sulfotransferase domain